MGYIANIIRCLLSGLILVPLVGAFATLWASLAILWGAFTGRKPVDSVTKIETIFDNLTK